MGSCSTNTSGVKNDFERSEEREEWWREPEAGEGNSVVLYVIESYRGVVIRSTAKLIHCGKLDIGTRDEAVVYISGLPFVLRDSSSPSKSYVLSSRASNLEAIEQRLKSDILQESLRYNGLLLIAEEVSSGSIVNQWIAVDSKTVKTPREIWEEMRTEEGYNVVYHRLPVRGDQAPEDGVLDEYTRVLASIKSSSSLVFNCGLGVGRTTFAMCAALIMRRGGMMRAGEDDPLLPSISSATYANMNGRVGGIRRNGEEEKILRSGREQGERDQSLLRLMNVLQNSESLYFATMTHLLIIDVYTGLIDGSSTNLLGMLSEHPRLLENLRWVTSLFNPSDFADHL